MNKKHKWILAILILVVFAFVFAYSFVIYQLTPPINKFGEFGDSFGILTALFSGLAFAGLITTIIMQGDELKMQRKELKLTRETLDSQKDEMQAQNKTLAKQRFENTFFKVLDFLEICIQGMRQSNLSFPNAISTGRHAISTILDVFKGKYLYSKKENGVLVGFKKECKEKDGISKAYLKFYGERGEVLGQYYRVLYNILKLVDSTDFTMEEKLVYTNLARAKLSKEELLLIFYNCLSPLGEKKMAPLIKKYKILKHLDESLLPVENLKLFKEFSEV